MAYPVGLLDWIFPRNIQCISCNENIDKDHTYSLCKKCFKKLDFFIGQNCYYCGKSISSGEICLTCEKNRYYFIKGYSVMGYDDFSKKLLFKFKNHKKTYMAYYYAQMIYDKIVLEGEGNFDCVTYIPSSQGKKNIRGFDTIKKIAEYVSEFTGIPIIPLISKAKETKDLKGLSAAERETQVSGAFKIKPLNLKINKCLLIDDVFTTGTTINEASKVIYETYFCDIVICTIYRGYLE